MTATVGRPRRECFLTLTGGSFGLQIGVQRSDIILVIMVPEGLDNLVSNQFSIGVDAGLGRRPGGPQRRGGDRPRS